MFSTIIIKGTLKCLLISTLFFVLQSCVHQKNWRGCYSSSKELEGYYELRICIYDDGDRIRYKRCLFSDVGGMSKLQKGICYVKGDLLIIPNHLLFDSSFDAPNAPKVEVSPIKAPEGFDVKSELPINNDIQAFILEKKGGRVFLRENKMEGNNLTPKKGKSYLLQKVSDKIVTDEELQRVPLSFK